MRRVVKYIITRAESSKLGLLSIKKCLICLFAVRHKIKNETKARADCAISLTYFGIKCHPLLYTLIHYMYVLEEAGRESVKILEHQ